MAAVTRTESVTVRAARYGEGESVARLWRELWDVHESWGSYAGSKEPGTYVELGRRLDEDARIRDGEPALGRHIHIVAELGGEVVGQVEGWLERHGVDESTPVTCEVRSLVVLPEARRYGAGRALLARLANLALELSRAPEVFLAAEVLEANPGIAFYERLGYVSVGYTARLPVEQAARLPPSRNYFGRYALPADALRIALLDGVLAHRRRASGDLRFDRPRAVDATLLGAISGHLSRPLGPADPIEIVVTDPAGFVYAAASVMVAQLESPFVPTRRAILGRTTVDPRIDPEWVVPELVRTAARLAIGQGAAMMEICDIDRGGPLERGALATGARRWSRVMTKLAKLGRA